ncbi:MAG: hypothetical protein ACYS30_07025 [Planctomycetota bacterium]|jgi:hypothetical protein
MKLDYIKEKKELVSTVLLGISALFGLLILIKVTGFFMASTKAEELVKRVVAQNNVDANDMEKYLAESKAIADELKKKNLFAPPPPKKHPVNQVSGILGDEVLINGKWYKVGDKVGDAKIVAIEPTQVRIEWDGKEKVFAPISAASSGGPGGPRRVKATAKGDEIRRRAEITVVRPGGGSKGPSSEERAILEKERAMEARQRAMEAKQKTVEVQALNSEEVTSRDESVTSFEVYVAP